MLTLQKSHQLLWDNRGNAPIAYLFEKTIKIDMEKITTIGVKKDILAVPITQPVDAVKAQLSVSKVEELTQGYNRPCT